MVHFQKRRSGSDRGARQNPVQHRDAARHPARPARSAEGRTDAARGSAGGRNSYFDGITSHNGFIVKGHPGCSRYENGFPTFNTPMRPGMDIGNEGKTDCRTQGDFGVAIVTIRNFYVIDEESQAVMIAGMFRRDARNPKRRNHFTELFHLDHGKIRDIHATFYYPPDDRPVPNWPPYDGLFPLPASYR